ncbi:uncharacterized protein HD556DRAFT_1443200 [Suillus plorans]|uniref:Myb-like domain-containing protein n=1 Tax=Suillus plorans TaxID=116603 RepID=A0A9P7DIJ2_9AGAM|nr:uncharacterized protein HD556DRAFT_1443200 [Suillus plorans]KAG1794250.1 hypothetical protein HD556DRAFT_1443200 [Suillus plorans]
MVRGKKSAPECQDPETKDRCFWTLDDETHLIQYIATHRAKGGNGMNFDKTFWTSASNETSKHTTQGAPKTIDACQSKWVRLRSTFGVVDSIATYSGWEYSLEHGANITAESETVWTDYMGSSKGSARVRVTRAGHGYGYYWGTGTGWDSKTRALTPDAILPACTLQPAPPPTPAPNAPSQVHQLHVHSARARNASTSVDAMQTHADDTRRRKDKRIEEGRRDGIEMKEERGTRGDETLGTLKVSTHIEDSTPSNNDDVIRVTSPAPIFVRPALTPPPAFTPTPPSTTPTPPTIHDADATILDANATIHDTNRLHSSFLCHPHMFESRQHSLTCAGHMC